MDITYLGVQQFFFTSQSHTPQGHLPFSKVAPSHSPHSLETSAIFNLSSLTHSSSQLLNLVNSTFSVSLKHVPPVPSALSQSNDSLLLLALVKAPPPNLPPVLLHTNRFPCAISLISLSYQTCQYLAVPGRTPLSVWPLLASPLSPVVPYLSG